MKISYQWLKSYCPQLTLSPEQVAEKLLLAGFPVETLEPTGQGDWLLDVEVTSNRPDLLGHIGMAREVAALCGIATEFPQPSPAGECADELAQRTAVQLDAPELCPFYTARLIRGVKVGPSPAWLVERIESIGLRPVNNVVDVTNFVLYEYSQPLHAFDHDKLAEGRIVVRRARGGEKMVSIDGHLRELEPSMLVIADARNPVAVAGVMGGLDSEVAAHTTNVLLESAWFEPMSVRATARKLGLFSDASFRFERGVDPAGVIEASNRAADLIVQIAGGVAVAGLAIDPTSADWPAERAKSDQPAITLRLPRIAQLLGVEVATERVMAILAGLHLSPRLSSDRRTVSVTAPSFRQDLRREVDLIEEVARVEGYDRIPVRDQISLEVRPPNFRFSTIRRIARTLASLGLYETVSISFVPADRAELFAFDRGHGGHLEVSHSSRRQENALRRSLLPSLLTARRHNETVQADRADLFEIASTFDPGDGLPRESLRVALTTDGDFRFARGLLEQLVEQLDVNATLTLAPSRRAEFVAGRSADVLIDGQAVGLIGEPTAELRERFGLGQPVTVAELDVEPLLTLASRPRTFHPLSRLPAIERDVSILVDEQASWQQIREAIGQSAPSELEAVEFADIFRGKQLPPGQKSVTLRLRYRSPETTLTNEQANAFVAAALASLAKSLGATLRE